MCNKIIQIQGATKKLYIFQHTISFKPYPAVSVHCIILKLLIILIQDFGEKLYSQLHKSMKYK